MSPDRRIILRLLQAAGDWVHRYSLTDHPDLCHLTYQQLTYDLRWLRQRQLLERRQTTIPSRRVSCYPTNEYRLVSGAI